MDVEFYQMIFLNKKEKGHLIAHDLTSGSFMCNLDLNFSNIPGDSLPLRNVIVGAPSFLSSLKEVFFFLCFGV